MRQAKRYGKAGRLVKEGRSGAFHLFCLLIAGMTMVAHGAEKGGAASGKLEKATLGGGCFWCVEAVYEKLEGVEAVISGYAGGEVANPSYHQVCTGNTGHAEVVQIEYDPEEISYDQLLEVFWKAHDPTLLNRQGADLGPQYRSIILYHDEAQKKAAHESKRKAASQFEDPIVTEIVPLEKFYPAEGYHQDYYRKNPNAPYCAFVIEPKLKKLKKQGTLE